MDPRVECVGLLEQKKAWAAVLLAIAAAVVAIAPGARAGSVSMGDEPTTEASARNLSHKGLAGVNVTRPTLAAPDPVIASEIARMRDAGVSAVRVPVDWSLVQPTRRSIPNLAWLDRLMILGSRKEIEVLPFVYGSPKWAAARWGGCRRCGEDMTLSARQPRSSREFAKFVALLVRRYGTGGSLWKNRPPAERRPVTAWQVWNEPDLPAYWPSDRWAPEYGRLLRATSSAIRKIDRGATIVLAALTNRSPEALSVLLREGNVAGSFDVAAINLFTLEVRDQRTVVQAFRDVLDSGGLGRVPIWITEWTWLSGAENPGWQFPPVVPTGERESRVRGTLDEHADMSEDGTRLARAFWYSWASSYSGGDPFSFSGLNAYTAAAGSNPQPALNAWSGWFDGE